MGGFGNNNNPNRNDNLKPFKKGFDSRRNTKGRPPKVITKLREIMKIDTDEEIAPEMSRDDYRRVALWLLERDAKELAAIMKSKPSMFVQIIIMAIQKDLKRGTMYSFNDVFDRFVDNKTGNEPTGQTIVFNAGFELTPKKNDGASEKPEQTEEPKKQKKKTTASKRKRKNSDGSNGGGKNDNSDDDASENNDGDKTP